jgi:phosphoribosylanthranilate isomerase
MVRVIRETANELGRFTPEIVGVVGQMSLAVATQLVPATGIDAIQLVGEDHDCIPLADALDGTPIIRSIAVADDADVDELRARTEYWESRGARIAYDAQIDGELGGTGHRIRADVVRPLLAAGRYGLAGGLHPDNVAEVIRDLRPAMVDVSSGIESHAGHKDPELMRAFVAAVRAAELTDVPDFLTDTTAPEADAPPSRQRP